MTKRKGVFGISRVPVDEPYSVDPLGYQTEFPQTFEEYASEVRAVCGPDMPLTQIEDLWICYMEQHRIVRAERKARARVLDHYEREIELGKKQRQSGRDHGNPEMKITDKRAQWELFRPFVEDARAKKPKASNRAIAARAAVNYDKNVASVSPDNKIRKSCRGPDTIVKLMKLFEKSYGK